MAVKVKNHRNYGWLPGLFMLMGALAVATSSWASGSGRAGERVTGVEEIQLGMTFEELFVALLQHPITDAELDLFVENLDALETWDHAHPKQWGALWGAKDPVALMRSWERLWLNCDLTPEETLALVLKLETAKEASSRRLTPEALRQGAAPEGHLRLLLFGAAEDTEGGPRKLAPIPGSQADALVFTFEFQSKLPKLYTAFSHYSGTASGKQ